jgi:hypothetical protein
VCVGREASQSILLRLLSVSLVHLFSSSFLRIASVHRLSVSLHHSCHHSCPSFQFTCIFWMFHSIIRVLIPVRRFSSCASSGCFTPSFRSVVSVHHSSPSRYRAQIITCEVLSTRDFQNTCSEFAVPTCWISDSAISLKWDRLKFQLSPNLRRDCYRAQIRLLQSVGRESSRHSIL